MADYRIAASLDELRRECDARAPMRSKESDGWIGNADHAATASDHNPNAHGVVCALDVTNDPANGADVAAWAEQWRLHPHPDVKYVLLHTEGLMWSSYPAHGFPPFTWRPYGGPRANEVHVSVGVGLDGRSEPPYDDRSSWFDQSRLPGDGQPPISSGGGGSVPAAATDPPFVWREDHRPMQHGGSIAFAQRILRDLCGQPLGRGGIDGFYGPVTANGVENVQRLMGIRVDRRVGPETWGTLLYVAALHNYH